jgi:glutaryl-CoA dehydrogenase
MGAAESSWFIAKDYAENRIVNNKQLAAKQLVQKKLADMQTEISFGLNACLQVGRVMDKNKDTRIAISMLKRNNCRKALKIVREARDMLGANGL